MKQNRIVIALVVCWLSQSHSFTLLLLWPSWNRLAACPTASAVGGSLTSSCSSTGLLQAKPSRNQDDDEKQNPNSNGKDDAWDDDVDYDKEFPSNPSADKSPDPALPWDAPSNAVQDGTNPFLETGKLGIQLDLGPMPEDQIQEIKAAATEVINDAIAAGIDDIEALRAKMKKEMDQQRQKMQLESEWQSQKAQEQLMRKIDQLTEDFLSKSAASRRSTKLAAAADRTMKGRGSEIGSWGVLGDTAIALDTTTEPTASPYRTGASRSDETLSVTTGPLENRILVVADTRQDAYAKQLLEPLTDALRTVVSDVQVDIFTPTATLPLGGNNAAAVLLFLTSLSDASSVKNALERLLRRTLQGDGKVARPPTQLVAVSTVGTERTNKMPYSMQNLLGGKLDKRRQMEEAVVNFVNQRVDTPSLDYTICKFGELRPTVTGAFSLQPGDSLDGEVQLESAVLVLQQAIALQTSARNATFACVGGSMGLPQTQQEWDEVFVPLTGPEIWRKDLADSTTDEFDRLIEYMHEWASLPESSQTLTTPIRVVLDAAAYPTPGVQEQSVMQFLYLPTNTGDKYLSKNEERARERQGGGKVPTSQVKTEQSLATAKKAKEGGIEILMETTNENRLRVRASRTNYAPGVAVKEMTEAALLNRLKKTISYWEEQKK